MGKAPARIETPRLVIRRPLAADAEAMFTRYAGDPEVTRYLGWPRHRAVSDTRDFLAFSDAEWTRWPAGPYMIESRTSSELLGGTGLGFDTPYEASTGYVLARDAWGHGYATEALQAMVELARALRVRRLYALCHPEHQASQHVLQKGGLVREAMLYRYAAFPNLKPGMLSDVLCYARTFDRSMLGPIGFQEES
jgi:ribosomal-protein-alanine N-acetyltransferase